MEVFMKARLMALLHRQYKLFFFVGSFLMHNLIFSNIIVTQFRTPLSLSELLHEGLLSVQEDIEQISQSNDQDVDKKLKDSFTKIEELQNLYDLMNSKSGLNEIHADERNFLQKLIDRIDQMIHTLEDNSSETDNDLIKRNIHLLHTLRTALED
jgi:uncharacterized protein YeeX (DUF496 family)